MYSGAVLGRAGCGLGAGGGGGGPPEDEMPDFIEWGADDVYDTFLALRDNPGWWNNNHVGTMTPHDMLEWLLSMEFSDTAATLVSSAIQKETTVRNFYSICSYRGGWCNSESEKDVIEYITAKDLANQAGRHILVPKGENPGSYWIDNSYRWSTVNFSGAFLNPGAWTSGHGNFRVPMDWGNISMFGDKTAEAKGLIEQNKGIGTETQGFIFTLGGGDPFVILNYCQDLYWHSDPYLEQTQCVSQDP